MARRDYVICDECKTKIIYDGYDNVQDRLEEVWGDPNADVWTVHLLCPDCIKKLQADLAAARALLRRYRNETPLGHQPHMIAQEVDAALAGDKP